MFINGPWRLETPPQCFKRCIEIFLPNEVVWRLTTEGGWVSRPGAWFPTPGVPKIVDLPRQVDDRLKRDLIRFDPDGVPVAPPTLAEVFRQWGIPVRGEFPPIKTRKWYVGYEILPDRMVKFDVGGDYETPPMPSPMAETLGGILEMLPDDGIVNDHGRLSFHPAVARMVGQTIPLTRIVRSKKK